jgi:hypothetical protein
MNIFIIILVIFVLVTFFCNKKQVGKFSNKEINKNQEIKEYLENKFNQNQEGYDHKELYQMIDFTKPFKDKPDWDTDADTYLRKRLVKGNRYPIKEEDRKDLRNYRDNFFAFRNSINQTSNDIDEVDKLNNLYLEGKGDISKSFQGKTIAQVFDQLTGNLDLYSKKCTRQLAPVAEVRVGHNGAMHTGNMWQYENEKTMNGGEFYGGIEPVDNTNILQQAI